MSICPKPETKCDYRKELTCIMMQRFGKNYKCLLLEPKAAGVVKKQPVIPKSDDPNKIWDVKEHKFKLRKPKTAAQMREMALGTPKHIRSLIAVDAGTRLLIQQSKKEAPTKEFNKAVVIPVLKAKVEVQPIAVAKIKAVPAGKIPLLKNQGVQMIQRRTVEIPTVKPKQQISHLEVDELRKELGW